MQVPGVYFEVKGDLTQLRKDMKEARNVVVDASKDISNALNNALDSSQITNGISKLVTNLGTLSRAAKVSGTAFDGLGVDLGELTKLTGMTAAQFSALQTRLLQTQAAKAQETALKNISIAAKLTNSEITSLGKQFGMTDAQIKTAHTSTTQTAGGFTLLGGAVRMAMSYMGVQQLISFGGAVLDTGLQVDSLERSFAAITGSQEGMRSEMEYLRTTANSTGQNMYALAESYKQLTASTQGTKIEGEATRAVFSSMSEAAAVLGLSNEKVELSIKAFAQMASKGVVQMEELKNQLGDHLPGALNIAARSMGVTQAELMKMSKEGELLAEELLPKMADELHRMYAEAAATAALESGRAAVNRLSQAWTDFKANLYDNDTAVAAINVLGESIQYWSDVAGRGKTLAGMREELAEVTSDIGKLKSALDEGSDGWLYLKFGGVDEAKAALTDLTNKSKDLALAVKQAENNADPAIAANVAAARKIQDAWLKKDTEIVEADERANTMMSDAAAALAKDEESSAKEATSALVAEAKKRAEDTREALKTVDDLYKEATMSHYDYEVQKTKNEFDELRKRVGNNKEAKAEIDAAEKAALAKLLTYDVLYRKDQQTELEAMTDSWKVYADGKVKADKEAEETIQEKTTETTSLVGEEWEQAMGSVQSELAGMVKEMDFSADSMVDIFETMLAEIVAAIAMSGISSMLADLFNMDGSVSLGSSFMSGISSALGSSGSSGGGAGGLVTSTVVSAAAEKAFEASGIKSLGTTTMTAISEYLGITQGAQGVTASYGMGSASASLAAAEAAQAAQAASMASSYGMGSASASLAAAEAQAAAAGSYTGAGAVGGSIEMGGASGASSGATGALAGAGYVAAFLAAVYALNNLGNTRDMPATDYMSQQGMSPETLTAFSAGWTAVEGTIMDINDESIMMGQAFMSLSDDMLYYTTSTGVFAQQWDEASQTWIAASMGAKLSITDLGASAQGASILTVEAANSIIASYTGQNLTMADAVTVANEAAVAFQGLSASERGTVGYSTDLQFKLMEMGLSASDAAAAADELIAQMEAEANATSGVATSATTATGSLGGLANIITEATDATTSSISTLASSLGGFSLVLSDSATAMARASETASSASFSSSGGSGISGQFHAGGRVPYDGSYFLKGGEEVITQESANAGSSQPQTIIVNIAGTEVKRILAPMIDAQVTAQAKRGMLSGRVSY